MGFSDGEAYNRSYTTAPARTGPPQATEGWDRQGLGGEAASRADS